MFQTLASHAKTALQQATGVQGFANETKPLVGADLSVMEADTRRMRGARPYVFASLRAGAGADDVARFVEEAGGLGR